MKIPSGLCVKHIPCTSLLNLLPITLWLCFHHTWYPSQHPCSLWPFNVPSDCVEGPVGWGDTMGWFSRREQGEMIGNFLAPSTCWGLNNTHWPELASLLYFEIALWDSLHFPYRTSLRILSKRHITGPSASFCDRTSGIDLFPTVN